MKTILSEKTNNLNAIDLALKISNFASMVITKKTLKFFANEKNGKLAPVAINALELAKKLGFEMISRPVGKAKICSEFLDGKTQDVVNQWTSYTLK